MKKQIISLFFAFCMLFLPLFPVMAADSLAPGVRSSEALLLGENGESKGSGSLKEISAKSEQYDTIQLQQDVEINVQQNGPIVGGISFKGSLDLNGHTLTISGPIPNDAQLIAGIVPMSLGEIKNGTIYLDFQNSSGSSSDSPFIYGVLSMASVTFTDLAIVTSNDCSVDAGIGISAGDQASYQEHNNFQNVTIDVGDATAISSAIYGNAKATVVSGSYKNLDTSSSIITVPSEPTTIPGVNGTGDGDNKVTVYTSDSTTAVIVQDGNAYLYDTLQEAVDAAAKRATTETGDKKKAEILVLKSPGSGTIELPQELNDIQVSVKKLNDDLTVSLGGVKFKGTDGKTYVIGENGILTEVTEEPNPDPVPPPVVVPSEPTYRPTITQTENGTVSTSPSYPEKDDKVTITATPEEGYKVGTVTVMDKNGNPVQVSSEGNGKCSYQQPEGSVTITVDFVWDNPFSDVKEGAWYYKAVRYVQLHGLMEGLPGNVFGPNKELTRAEAVQILYNLEGKPAVTGESTFTDVDGHWAVTPITWADQNKVIGGYGDGTFLPDKPVSREEFAQMMYNYTIYKKLDTSATADLTKFPDGTDVANWAETAMEWANGNELINGHEDGTLDPQGTANRAQAASILMQFDQNLVND